MDALLTGLGTATPPAVSQAEAAELAVAFLAAEGRGAQTIRRLYARSGVRERGSVLARARGDAGVEQTFYEASRGIGDRGPTTRQRLDEYARCAGELAARAAGAALADAGRPAGSITHLVTASCTGFAAPGVDADLVARLGLRRTVERTHVGFMGCHGALNALRVASAIVRADPGAVALVAAVELCSLHYQYGDRPDTIVSNALFADGAGAAVVEARSGAPAPGRQGAWRLGASGACIVPDTADAMTWRIEDHGFVMTLSARTPDLIRAHLRPWLSVWLDANGMGLTDIRSWAIHPGGPRIVSSAAEALGLDGGAVRPSLEVLERCGNMSSPTVLFNLDALRRGGAPTPCVALGFGPGLAIEAALFV